MRLRNVGMSDLVVNGRRIHPGETFDAANVPAAQVHAWTVAQAVRPVPRRKKEAE